MDERLAQVEAQKQAALNESNAVYNSLLSDNENLLKQQQDYANQYEKTQNAILDKQLAYNTEQIEKQKKTAQENKETESRKALNDYTAYTNPYGYQAESMAAAGLTNTGVSETSKLGAYTTYQNRLATANKTMQDAITQYDSAINEARLNNDVSKAQNALQKLQMQMEYVQTYYTNKGSIAQNQLSNNNSLNNQYFNQYQTVYENIQNEKAKEEAIRQYNEQMAYQKERDAVSDAQWQKEYNLSVAKANSSGSSSGGSSSGSSGNGGTVLTDNNSGVEIDSNGNTKTTSSYVSIVSTNGKTIQVDSSKVPSDYLMKNGYQAKYVVDDNGNFTKLTNTGKTASSVYSDLANQSLGQYKIWEANGHYYMFDMGTKDYIDITSDYNSKQKNKIDLWYYGTSGKKTTSTNNKSTTSSKSNTTSSTNNSTTTYKTTATNSLNKQANYTLK